MIEIAPDDATALCRRPTPKSSTFVSVSVSRPPSSKYHESVMFTLGRLSVLLHSFGQQVVQTGNHWPGVVVQAGCDHGVVVDLREARIHATTVTTALTHDKQPVAFSDTNDCESPIQKGIMRICTDILHIF